MSRNTTILNELNELAPALATIGTAPVFAVPEGYFDQLAENIQLKIKAEETIWAPKAGRETGFSVPEGYFDSLAGNILNRIKAEAGATQTAREEIAALSPLLSGISREMPYAFPRSYFDQLPERIAAENTGAKVVQMGQTRTRVVFRFMKYAAAACVVAFLAFGSYLLLNRDKAGGENTEIANTGYTMKQIKNFDLDKELEKLNNSEIGNYLCETGAIACNDSKDEDLSKKLGELTSDDLDSYLEGTN